MTSSVKTVSAWMHKCSASSRSWLLVLACALLSGATLYAAEEEVVYQDDFESPTYTVGNPPPAPPGSAWSMNNQTWFTELAVIRNDRNHTGGGAKSMYSRGGNSGEGVGAWNDPLSDPHWGPLTYGRAEVWFYDDMVAPKRQWASCDNTAGNNWLAVLMDTTQAQGATKYYHRGSMYAIQVSSIDRTLGWHKMEVVRDINNTTIYLDGVQLYIASNAQFSEFADLDLGTFDWININGGTGCWFDDAKVVRGMSQRRYCWCQDDAATPTPYVAENTAYSGAQTGTKYRLRMQLENGMSIAWAGSNVALRYRVGATGPWEDFGPTADWDYADGAGTNGNGLAGSVFGATTNVLQHYVEGRPSTASLNVNGGNPIGQRGEWDFAISPTANAQPGATYYIKAVFTDAAGAYTRDLVSYPYLAQVTVTSTGMKTWTGANSTLWNDAGNWTGGLPGVPGPADDVKIPDVANDPTVNASSTCNRLFIDAGATVTIAAGQTLTVTNSLLIASGATTTGTLLQNSTGNLVCTNGPLRVYGTHTISNTGTVTVGGEACIYYDMYNLGGRTNFTGASTYSTTSLKVYGLFATAAGTNNVVNVTNLSIYQGGEFRHLQANAAAQVNIAGNFTNDGSMSASTGGNFILSNAAAQIGGASTTTRFWRMETANGVGGSATISGTATPAVTVLDDLVLTSGALSMAGKTVDVGGDFINAAGSLSGAGGTLRFNGGTDANIDNGGLATSFQNVVCGKTGVGRLIAATRGLDITGNFTISGGEFVPGNFEHKIAGNWNDTGGLFQPTDGVIKFVGAAKTITTDDYFHHLQIYSGSASLGASKLDVRASLTISAGATLDCGANANSLVAGITSIWGTLNAGSGTTVLEGAVTVNNGGELRLQTGVAAPTVRLGKAGSAGSVIVATGGSFSAGGAPRPTLTAAAGAPRFAFTVQSGATVDIDGLNFDQANDNGLNIASGATIAQLDSCFFSGGSAVTTTYLKLGLTSGTYSFNFCDFDNNCLYNVSAPAGTLAVTMIAATGLKGATPAGEANDSDPGETHVNWTYPMVWTGATNTSWAEPTNWSDGAIPVSANDVIIPFSGVTNFPVLDTDATGAKSVKSLSVLAGATLSLNDALAHALTVDTVATFSGTVNHTTANVTIAGTTVTIGGTYTHNGAGVFNAPSATLTVSSGGTYTQSGTGSVTVGNLAVSGTYIQNTADNVLSLTNLTINSGGEFRNTQATLGSEVRIAGVFANNGSMALTSGGNFRFQNAACQIAGSSASTRFWRLAIEANTSVSGAATPAITVLGDVVLASGTLSAAGKTIEVLGNWTNDGGSFAGAGALVQLTGAAAVTLDNGTSGTATPFQNVRIAKNPGVTVTAGRGLSIAGNFTLASGEFVPAAFSHTVTGNWDDSGGLFAPAGGTVTLNGAAPTVTTAAGNRFWNLTIANGTASVGANELDVEGNLAVSAGATLDCGSGAANDVLGTTAISGTLKVGSGTVTLRGAVSVENGGTLNLTTTTVAPTLILGNGAVAGSITVKNGGTFTAWGAPQPTLTKQGSANFGFTIESGGTLYVDGLNFSGPNDSGMNIADGANVTSLSSCFFGGGAGGTNTYLTLGFTTGSYTFRFCDFDTNCQYNVALPDSGSTVIMLLATGAKGALIVAPPSSGEDFDNDPGNKVTWNYGKVWTGANSTDWSDGGNWSPAGVPTQTDDVAIPDVGNDPVLTALSQAGRLYVTNGVLGLGAQELQVYGDLAVESVAALNAGTGRVTLCGGADQAVRAPGKTFNDFYVNKTGGTASTVAALTIGQDFVLQGGTFEPSIFTHSIARDLLVTGGTLSPGTWKFTGAGASQIAGGATSLTLAGIVIDKGAAATTVTANRPLTLTGNLVLTRGTLAAATAVTLQSGVVYNGAAGASEISGALNLGGGVRAFDVANGPAAADLTVSATVSNGGLTKTGAGTLVLSGAATCGSGTVVNAGTLEVDNTLVSVLTVNTGGAISGNGTLNGAVTIAGGTLSPGLRVSTANRGIMQGASVDLSSGANSTLALRVQGFGAAGVDFDRLALSGQLKLGGTSRLLLNVSGLAGVGTIRIVTAGSVSGQFASVQFVNNPSGYAAGSIAYGADYLEISLAHPPTAIALDTSTIVENTVARVGTLSTTDGDAGDSFTYSLVSGAGSDDNALFAIANDDEVWPAAALNYETRSLYSIRVRSTDSSGLTFEQQFTITVTDVNEAPTNITLSSSSIAEDQPLGTAVGTFAVTDEESATQTYTYTLVAGAGDTDNASFAIVGNALQTGIALNYEAKSSYSVRVNVADSGAPVGNFEKVFVIAVTNVNEAPTDIVLSSSQIPNTKPLGGIVGTLSATDPDAGSTFAFAFAAGLNDTDNGKFTIDGSNNVCTAAGAYPLVGPYFIRIRVTDGGGAWYEEWFQITVSVVPQDPTDILLAPSSVNENQPSGTTVGTFTTIDPDGGGQTCTYTFAGGADDASFTIAGDQLRTASSFNYEATNSYAIRIRTTDRDGRTYDKDFTITVLNVNEAPVLTATAAPLAYTENDPATAVDGGLAVADVDSANISGATVRITGNYVSGEDVLEFTAINGVAGSFDAGAGTMTLSGTETKADYQAALRAVKYRNTSENPSTAARTVTFLATDDGGVSSASATRTINITSVNDIPVVTLTVAAATYTENDPPMNVDGALTIVDVDSANQVSASVQITGNYANGQDLLEFATLGGISGSFEAGTGTLTLTGSATLANYQAALRTVKYRNSSDNPSTLSRTVRIIITDEHGGTSAPKTRDINVVAINDAPAVTTTAAPLAYTENDPATAVDAGITATDPDSANLTQAVVQITTNYANGQDVLAFVDGGGITGNWVAATGTLTLSGAAAPAAYQAALRTVTYVNTSEDPSTAARTVTFSVSDVALTSPLATRIINVSAVNDVPVVTTTVAPLAYTENDPATAIDSALTVTDGDDGNLTGATVQITGNYANGQDLLSFVDMPGITGSFAAGTGTMTLSGTASVADYQTALRTVSYRNSSDNPSVLVRTVTFIVTDETGGSSAAKTRTINITAVNDAPTDIALSSDTILVPAVAPVTVGTLSTTDVDSVAPFTYTLVAGAGDTDNASFIIVGSLLRTNVDFAAAPLDLLSVRVRTTDSGGQWYEEALTIRRSNTNTEPSGILLAPASVQENQPAGTTVGTLTPVDPDGGSQTHTFTLVAGAGDADNASFAIVGTDLRTAAVFNREAKSSYNVRVQVSDGAGGVFATGLVITVTDVNDAPTDIALSSASVAENQPAGTVVGTFTPTDDESATQTYTYTLVAGAGSNDNASFTIAANQLRTAAAFDYETKNSYSIRVRVTDNGVPAQSFEKVFTITITNVNEGPPAVASAPTATPNPATVGETVVFSVSATDPDGDTVTYSWNFGDGTAATGATASHAYALASGYTVTVTISDGNGGSISSSLTVVVQSGVTPPAADDNDGYSEEIETALGSSPTDPASTPFGLPPAMPGGTLVVSKMSVKLNFSKANMDAVGLSGTLPIPDGFTATGKRVIVDVGGIVKAFELNAKGSSPKANDTFKLAFKSKKGVVAAQTAKYALKFMKGSFAETLEELGLVNETTSASVSIPVTLILDAKVYETSVPQAYKGKQGKTGSTKK